MLRMGAVLGIGGIVGLCFAGCGRDERVEEPLIVELDEAICQPGAGALSADVTNPYFPLPVGKTWVLEGTDEEGVAVRVESEVQAEPQEVAGVLTRSVFSRELEDGEIIEETRDFYVQAADGTVCTYGEDVELFEDGVLVSKEGAWRAGVNGATPGIFLPGTPAAGQRFRQENAPGVAEDESAVLAVGVPTPSGSFQDTAYLVDWNPLEGQTFDNADDKFYARGVGLVVDDVLELVSQP